MSKDDNPKKSKIDLNLVGLIVSAIITGLCTIYANQVSKAKEQSELALTSIIKEQKNIIKSHKDTIEEQRSYIRNLHKQISESNTRHTEIIFQHITGREKYIELTKNNGVNEK